MADCPNKVEFLVEWNNKQAIYTIEFQGITAENGKSTWCYKVKVEGDPALSHWVLGVCPKDKIILVTRNGQELEKDEDYEIGTFHGISGIKFDDGVEKEEGAVTYCITLDGIYEKEAVDVAVKGGPDEALTKEDALCGPSCETGGNGGNGDGDEIADLLESIALQEAGLAHIINAEGEKIQAAIEKYILQNATLEDLMAVNKSVEDVLTKVINMEMILEFKLEEVSKINCNK